MKIIVSLQEVESFLPTIERMLEIADAEVYPHDLRNGLAELMKHTLKEYQIDDFLSVTYHSLTQMFTFSIKEEYVLLQAKYTLSFLYVFRKPIQALKTFIKTLMDCFPEVKRNAEEVAETYLEELEALIQPEEAGEEDDILQSL